MFKLINRDCNEALLDMKTDSVDLIIGSPPYEDMRTYGELNFGVNKEDWADWLFLRMVQMARVSKGLVAMVVSDKTENFEWSAATIALMYKLKTKSGLILRRPCLYVRHGVPGSGGKDWFKNRYEFIVCVTKCPGELPWHDVLACGHPPVLKKKGGKMTNRNKQGKRASRHHTKPPIANPGNIIDCGANTILKGAHENEAPYPEKVPERLIRSFCPPGGLVLDPFCGSGTTGVVAVRTGRSFIGIDIRSSQIELTEKRLRSMQTTFGF